MGLVLRNEQNNFWLTNAVCIYARLALLVLRKRYLGVTWGQRWFQLIAS